MLAGHAQGDRQQQGQGAHVVHEGREDGHGERKHKQLQGQVAGLPGDQVNQPRVLEALALHEHGHDGDGRGMPKPKKGAAAGDHPDHDGREQAEHGEDC